MLTQEELKRLLHYDPETGVFTWCQTAANLKHYAGDPAGTLDGQGYISISLKGKVHKAHRLAWLYVYGTIPPQYLIHVNTHRVDNRLLNLVEKANVSKLTVLTQARLKELLNYDPQTGVFVWVSSNLSGTKKGDTAGAVDHGYRTIQVDGKLIKAHRLAWLYVYGVFPKGKLDHRNRIRSDNRIDNLREATHAENMRNAGKRANNTSGYKGVSRRENGRWVAQCSFSNKKIHIGVFDSPQEAHEAYCAFTAPLHQEFFHDGVPTA